VSGSEATFDPSTSTKSFVFALILIFNFIKYYRLNKNITSPQLRLVDEEGKHLGVFPREEALKMAEEKELDLIEINPTGNPPVAKITDFGQFKYDQRKKETKQKGKKEGEMKTLWLSAKIGQHDLEHKKLQIEKFLEKKKRVKVEIILKGRERQHADLALKLLENLIKDISYNDKTTGSPQKLGNKIFILIEPL